jgi:hypothetical protein
MITVPERPGLHVERLASGGVAVVSVEILTPAAAQTLLDNLGAIMRNPPPTTKGNVP